MLHNLLAISVIGLSLSGLLLLLVPKSKIVRKVVTWLGYQQVKTAHKIFAFGFIVLLLIFHLV